MNKHSLYIKICKFLVMEDKVGALYLKWMRLWQPFFYRRRFDAFGKGSVLRRPMRIIGKKSIHIGVSVDIMDGLRMEAVSRWGGVEYSPKINIGDATTIGQNCHFTAANEITIGTGVSILPDVLITDIEHQYIANKRLSETGLSVGFVSIGDYTIIGMGARILGHKGITIGKNVIIGANAVVTKSIPDDTIVAGIPASIIKKRNLGNVAEEK